MKKFSMQPYPAHFIGAKAPHLRHGAGVILSGVMAIFYFGRLIALVNELGEIVWRDHTFPKFLVEYLIETPQPDPGWSRWN